MKQSSVLLHSTVKGCKRNVSGKTSHRRANSPLTLIKHVDSIEFLVSGGLVDVELT